MKTISKEEVKVMGWNGLTDIQKNGYIQARIEEIKEHLSLKKRDGDRVKGGSKLF